MTFVDLFRRARGFLSTASASIVVVALASSTSAWSQTKPPIVVVSTELAPFMFSSDGKPAGFEYDLLQFFAKSRDRELQVRWVKTFPEVLQTLESGGADVAAAGLTVTAERKKTFDFSNSHFPSQAILLLRASSAAKTLADVTGKVGVLGSTTVSQSVSKLPRVVAVEANSERPLVQQLLDGTLDAVASEAATAFRFAEEFPQLKLGPKLGDKQEFAFALVKGSPLSEALGAHVLKIRGSVVYYRLVEEYFGSNAVDIIRAARE